MRALSCIVLFVLVAMAQGDKPYYDAKNGPVLFEQFMKDYDRQYKDDADKEVHYQAFLKNLGDINKANADPNDPAIYGITKFADYTPEESSNIHGLKVPTESE